MCRCCPSHGLLCKFMNPSSVSATCREVNLPPRLVRALDAFDARAKTPRRTALKAAGSEPTRLPPTRRNAAGLRQRVPAIPDRAGNFGHAIGTGRNFVFKLDRGLDFPLVVPDQTQNFRNRSV